MAHIKTLLSTRLSPFWRYVCVMIVVLSLAFLSLSIMSNRFSEELQTSRLEQTKITFENDCDFFSRDLFETYALPSVLESTNDFITAGNTPVDLVPEQIYCFSLTRNLFGSLCSVQNLPAESFLYFGNNGVCLTRTRIFIDEDAFFYSYLTYEDPSQIPDLYSNQSSSKLQLQLLPLCNISVNGRPANSYLTLLVRNKTYNTLYGFLYPQQDILNTFHLDSMPDNSVLTLSYSDGTQIFPMNDVDDRDSYMWLTQSVPVVSCQISLGIPLSYFDSVVHDVKTTAQIIYLLSIVAGLALCFAFSYADIRRYNVAQADGKKGAPANAALSQSDNHYTSPSQLNLFLSNLLIRATVGMPIPADEYQKALTAFPMFQHPLCAAAVYDRATDESESQQPMDTLLRTLLPDQFFCEYFNRQEAILLLPATEEASEALNVLLHQMNKVADPEIRFVCGLSDAFVGLNHAGVSIRQAQLCVPERGDVLVARPQFYPGDAVPATVDSTLLQQALTNRNQSEVLSQIEQLAVSAGKTTTTSPEELFYLILFLLRNTARVEKIPFHEYEKMTYQHSHSPASNLRRLKEAANCLFEQWAAVQLSDRQIRCEQIVQYIRDHFSDPALCMASLAKQFQASERFVYNSVQEITGMNVSSFLAQVRMHEAGRLLRETDESVSSIAERCGYSVESTFYRNFKKYYHVTPAEYKSSLR